MANNYGGKPMTNLQPQRGGTPRNTGSPPPDLPPDRYSEPPRTQSAKPAGGARGSEHQWTPQPNQRPHERGNKRQR